MGKRKSRVRPLPKKRMASSSSSCFPTMLLHQTNRELPIGSRKLENLHGISIYNTTREKKNNCDEFLKNPSLEIRFIYGIID